MLGKTVVVGVLCYGGLLVLLRWFGNRSLSKWNAFDWAISVAIGSTLANCLLSKDVSLLQGLVAFAVLLGMQFTVTWLSMRFPFIARIAKSKPVLLLRDGRVLHDAMHRERVVENEIYSALRSAGLAKVEDAAAVVLETDGSFTVVKELGERGGTSTLQDVRGFE